MSRTNKALVKEVQSELFRIKVGIMRVYTNNYTKVFLIDPITASIERAGLFRWDWCLVGYDWNKDIDASPVINIIPFNDIDSVTFDTKDVR